MKRLFLLVVVAACGPSSPPAVTPNQVAVNASLGAKYIDTFRSVWAAKRSTMNRELIDGVDPLVGDPKGPLTARSESCRARRQFIQTHIPEIASLIVVGSLDRLDRDGACGLVEVDGGEKREAEGVLTPDGAEVLLVWVVPEG